jgi:two-component system, OmpR family, response regulator
VQIGRLSFELSSREVLVGGAPLCLPRRELALLELLVRRAGRVVQRSHLDSEIYGFGAEVSTNALETQISRLRHRLVEANAQVEIRTIRGVGYLLKPC